MSAHQRNGSAHHALKCTWIVSRHLHKESCCRVGDNHISLLSGPASGIKDLSIEFDKSAGVPTLSSRFYLEHVETMEVKLYVYESESLTMELDINDFKNTTISTNISSSMATLGVMNTEESERIEESIEIVVESDDTFVLKVPSGTKYGSSLPMDTGLNVELYIFPEEMYSKIVFGDAKNPQRRLLVLGISQPYQWKDTQESINTIEPSSKALFRLSSSIIVTEQSESLAPQESLSDDSEDYLPLLEDYRGHPSVLYYMGSWDEEHVAYTIDVFLQEGNYHALLAVSFGDDVTITEFPLQVFQPEGEGSVQGNKEFYLDIVLSFPTLQTSSYPGGKKSLALDTKMALSFICQVKGKTFPTLENKHPSTFWSGTPDVVDSFTKAFLLIIWIVQPTANLAPDKL